MSRRALCVLRRVVGLVQVEAAGIEPADDFFHTVWGEEVASGRWGRSAYLEHSSGSSRQGASFPDSYDDECRQSMRYIKAAWPHLPPYVKDAIFTLIDSTMHCSTIPAVPHGKFIATKDTRER